MVRPKLLYVNRGDWLVGLKFVSHIRIGKSASRGGSALLQACKVLCPWVRSAHGWSFTRLTAHLHYIAVPVGSLQFDPGEYIYTEGLVSAQQDLKPESLSISPICSHFDQHVRGNQSHVPKWVQPRCCVYTRSRITPV